MTVVVKYVVERNGEEKMTFTSKAEADAYDKMLDMADAMFDLLAKSNLITDEGKQEEISLYLAENKEELLYALGAKKRPSLTAVSQLKVPSIEPTIIETETEMPALIETSENEKDEPEKKGTKPRRATK